MAVINYLNYTRKNESSHCFSFMINSIVNHKLLLAVVSSNDQSVSESILGGANVNCIASSRDFPGIHQVGLVGLTPLMIAAGSGYEKIVALLLDNGASLDVFKKNTGESALSLAVHYGNANCINLLLERGALLDQKDNHFSSPLLAACTHFDHERDHLILIERLLKNGANVNARDQHGFTALMRMMCRGNFEQQVIRLLLDYHALLDVTNDAGIRCFDLAMIEGYAERVDFIISYLEQQKIGALVNQSTGCFISIIF